MIVEWHVAFCSIFKDSKDSIYSKNNYVLYFRKYFMKKQSFPLYLHKKNMS